MEDKILIGEGKYIKYYAGRDGNLYTQRGKIKPYNGYVNLSLTTGSHHLNLTKLIADAFDIKPTTTKPYLYHKDGDISNNAVDNLIIVNNEMLAYPDDDEWKTIPDTNNYYQLSKNGFVRANPRFVPQDNKPTSYIFKPGKVLEARGKYKKYVILRYDNRSHKVFIEELQKKMNWGI